MTIVESATSERPFAVFDSDQYSVNGQLSQLVTCNEWSEMDEAAFQGWLKEVNGLTVFSYESAWKAVAEKWIPICIKHRGVALLERILVSYPERETLLNYLKATLIKHMEQIMEDPKMFEVAIRHGCPNAIKNEVFCATASVSFNIAKNDPAAFFKLIELFKPGDQADFVKILLMRYAWNGGSAD